MKDIVIIKNSNTLLNNDVYFPDINEIESGELVLNNSTGKETLFVKNDVDDIVPFRSKQYTLDKINTSIPTITISETAPDKPKEGDFWIEPIPPIPFTLEFNVLPDNLIVTLPISGNVNCEIDWGSGNNKEIVTSDRPSHTYQTAGTYIVKISGDFEKMYNCSTNVTRVISWGNSNVLLTNMDSAFSRCVNLIEIPNDDYESFINVSSFLNTFSYCSNLVSIPGNLFLHCYNVSSFNGTFSNCTKLQSIPEELFDNCINVIDMAGVFSSCTNLTSIPSTLFVNNINVTNFSSAFASCRSLVNIPETLFTNNIEVTSFLNIFQNDNKLDSIPSNLFSTNTKVTTFGGAFSSCTGLTSIPSTLFVNNTIVTNFSFTFSGCYNITSIPNELFVNNREVTTFANLFNNCSGITSVIPNNIFNVCKKVTNFSNTFGNCSGLTGNTPTGTDGLELWERAGQTGYPTSINGNKCFTNCYNLVNYDSISSEWK